MASLAVVEPDRPASLALLASVNRDRAELGLEPLAEFAWWRHGFKESLVKRIGKGSSGGGRFTDKPKAFLPERAQAPRVETAPSARPAVAPPPTPAKRVPAKRVPAKRATSAVEQKATAWRASFDAARAKVPPPDRFGRDAGHWTVDALSMHKQTPLGQTLEPGPRAKQHFVALMDTGWLADEELERRIQARLAEFDMSKYEAFRDQIAQAERIEKKHSDAIKAMDQKIEGRRQDLQDKHGFDSEQALYDEIESSGPRADLAQRILDEVTTMEEDPRLVELYQKRKRVRQIKENHQRQMEKLHVRASQIQREETLAMLKEIRPMGGKADFDLDSKTDPEAAPRISAAMARASDVYPTEWIDGLSKDMGGKRFTLGASKRGYFRRDASVAEIYLSPKRPILNEDAYDRVATHEFAHAMESSNEAIRIAQWLMSHHRAPRNQSALENISNAVVSKGARKAELGYRDDWRDAYTGRVYADSPNANWEIFSTGMESLFHGAEYLGSASPFGPLDREQRAFILALLAVM